MLRLLPRAQQSARAAGREEWEQRRYSTVDFIDFKPNFGRW
jgi:hypothetical protein